MQTSIEADAMYYDYPMPSLLQQELFWQMRDFPNPWKRYDLTSQIRVSRKNDEDF